MKENRYDTQKARLELAKEIASEAVVLLKNEDGFLPLQAQTVAVIGMTAYKPNLGGMGSGMSFMGKEIPSMTDAMKKVGLIPEEGIDQFYQDYFAAIPPENPFAKFIELRESGVDLVASGAVYEIFGQYSPQREEIEIPQKLWNQAKETCDTAVLVFGRSTGGEECDRHVDNDFYLLDSEKAMIADTCKNFKQVVLLVNTNGLTDLSWIDSYPQIKSVMFIGAGGEQGMDALAELLVGRETPSGKLAFTIATSYEAYPTSEDFSWDKDHPENIREYKDYGLDAAANGSVGFDMSPVDVYREGLYMGYRYFDSFGKEVLYPFGFGLSYAGFVLDQVEASLISGKDAPLLQIQAHVINTSSEYAGKEVVQLYVSSPEGSLEQPYQGLKGWVKTELICPESSQDVAMEVSIRELASYDEDRAAWVLEAGEYLLRVGNSSRHTHVIGKLLVQQDIVTEQLSNCLTINPKNLDSIDFLSAKDAAAITYEGEMEEIQKAPVLTVASQDMITLVPDHKEKHTGLELVKQMSDDQLMAMAVGYGSGLPFASMMDGSQPLTIQDDQGEDITTNSHPSGAVGYVSPAITKLGIPSACYKDGPASVGMIAWPTEMTLACTFNQKLCYDFGAAAGREADEQQVDSWLAPAMNLHRNPIGGRNFEYFSEDPYVTGICGAAVCQGAAENNYATCCPKHFALNEQETYRRGSRPKNIDAVDSVVTERVARELYLKPFEMTIKNAPVRTIMTSFNKINGTFAGGRQDLNTQILRKEWGFEGVVVTDWGDMDFAVDGADAVAAGNDIVMPGGPPVIAQMRQGLSEGRVTREQLELAVEHLLIYVFNSQSYELYLQKE